MAKILNCLQAEGKNKSKKDKISPIYQKGLKRLYFDPIFPFGLLNITYIYITIIIKHRFI